MSPQKWIILTKIAGELQAELMRGLLEAQGIPVMLAQEGAARAIGITTGPLGEVEIMIPEDKLQDARDILTRYQSGDFENPETLDP